MNQSRDPEADLQRHGAALHTLALALLRDRQAAEDVVQDAFVDFLRRQQSVRSPAGWLAAAVRTFAMGRQRAAARRLARERIAARPEAVPGAVATAARRELLHRLVEAVHALDEPYRETVWQRYFEELQPAAIAARAKVPVATVK